MKYPVFLLKVSMVCLGLLAVSIAHGQYDCKEYEKFNCAPSADKHFHRNGQSRSAMIQIGVASEMNIIVYKGQDYRISICSDPNILGDVSFRLIELRRELVQTKAVVQDSLALADSGTAEGGGQEPQVSNPRNNYQIVRKVLYDNTEDEMSQSIEFSSTATKRIVLEIIAPGSDNPKRLEDANSPNIGCVGVLVEHMATPRLGF